MGFTNLRSCLSNSFRFFSVAHTNIRMKYLNVAEKNDAAKNIAAILSRGNSNRREGLSIYNKIYEFDAQVFGEQCRMVMTSVSGHLLNYAFGIQFKNWLSCNPLVLFDAPVSKVCPKDFENIRKTLEREIRSCQGLIIWTDCDREGENIGFEIIKVCTDVKPNLRIYRAKFSEITAASVFRALNTLGQPNKNISEAVDVRQELDLRTGAAFTRLQTLRLQKVFPQKLADKLISYGSCQFPTLGFVVERYKAIEEFQSEPFWRIKMNHTVKELTTDFLWKRDRLFDKNACGAILDECKENPQATVESVDSKPKSKWRPLPLDTVEMEKTVSRKLKINAKDTMKIAEKLYTQGYISYPRTETNIFPKELNLANLVEQQRVDGRWGTFADRIINEGGPTPRQGKKSDQAHPPIHPIKYVNTLTGNDQRVYEYIVRHFLACVHKDAQGFETVVSVDIAGEKFTAKGLIVLEKNYLEVYIYEKWNAKEINNYQQGQTFMPSVLDMVESATSPPKLLTEADLIALMEKHGIGTDATHADHIDTIKQREYVGLHENMYFVPGTLGMGLVEGYNNIGLEVSLAKPNLRAEFENDLKLICEGRKDAEVVRREQVAKYREVFRTVAQRMRLIDDSLSNRLDDRPQEFRDDNMTGNQGEYKPAMKCPKCGSDMIVRNKKNGTGKFISCVLYPQCKNALWLPNSIENIEILNDSCPQKNASGPKEEYEFYLIKNGFNKKCLGNPTVWWYFLTHVLAGLRFIGMFYDVDFLPCGPNYKMLKIKFKPNPFPGEPNPNTLCLGGCDLNVMDTLGLSLNSVRQNNNDNGNAVVPNNANNVVQNGPGDNIPNRNNQNNLNNWLNLPANDNVNNNRNNSNRTSNTNRSHTDRSSSSSSSTFNNNSNSNNRNNPWPSNTSFAAVPSTSRQPLDFLPGPSGSNTNNNRLGGNGSFVNTSTGGETDVMCQCNQEALQLTVKKDGPNKGKQFYACANRTCSFFLWATNDDNNTTSNTRDRPNNDNGSELKCQCDLPAVARTVSKAGPNTGRQFYCCPKPIGEGCKFFKWADEVNDGGGGGGGDDDNDDDGGGGGLNYSFRGSASRGRGRGGRGGNKRSHPYNRPKGGRKCGRCGIEGHNKNKCPN